MSLIVVVAGRYTSAYQASAAAITAGAPSSPFSLGVLTDDGWQLTMSVNQEVVNATDAYNKTIVEVLNAGLDVRLRFTCMEYGVGPMVAAWPWAKGAQELSPQLGIIGTRGTDYAGSLVLTVTSGTPAATHPSTLTAPLCIPASSMQLNMNFTSKVRQVPIDLQLLPSATTTIQHFGTT